MVQKRDSILMDSVALHPSRYLLKKIYFKNILRTRIFTVYEKRNIYNAYTVIQNEVSPQYCRVVPIVPALTRHRSSSLTCNNFDIISTSSLLVSTSSQDAYSTHIRILHFPSTLFSKLKENCATRLRCSIFLILLYVGTQFNLPQRWRCCFELLCAVQFVNVKRRLNTM